MYDPLTSGASVAFSPAAPGALAPAGLWGDNAPVLPLRAVSVAAALGLLACRDNATPISPAPPASATPRFIDANFPEIYQLFLKRTLPERDKTERWIRSFQNRWVRWSGQLVAISNTGLKMRQLQTTMTFDVSVMINEPQRSQLRAALRPGKFYTYIARLDRYDDVFRTLYLNQGSVVNPNPEGAPGKLDPMPPPLHLAPFDGKDAPGPAAAPRTESAQPR